MKSLALPRNENGGAMTEVTATAVSAASAGSIRVSDTKNHTLTLVRVQASDTARLGRGLVRFITDLVQRAEKPIPVVAECPDRCGRFYNVSVDLSDADKPVVLSLPGNCRQCGACLDTYEMNRDLIATARLFAETARFGTPCGYCTECEQRFETVDDENKHVEVFGHRTSRNVADAWHPGGRAS
jgi:hypothetical protein